MMSPGNNYGVAKGASLVDVQVFGERGTSSYSTILDGMSLRWFQLSPLPVWDITWILATVPMVAGVVIMIAVVLYRSLSC